MNELYYNAIPTAYNSQKQVSIVHADNWEYSSGGKFFTCAYPIWAYFYKDSANSNRVMFCVPDSPEYASYDNMEIRLYEPGSSSYLTVTVHFNDVSNTFTSSANDPLKPNQKVWRYSWNPNGWVQSWERMATLVGAGEENNFVMVALYGDKIREKLPNEIDPYVDYGEGSIGGDVIGVPGLPTVSAVDTGLVTLYSPTISEMQRLADYLWTSITPGSGTDGILKEIAQGICRLIADPMKVIMGLSILPSRGISVTSQRYLFSNDFIGVSQVYMKKLTSQYYAVDCGSLTFNTLCGDTFLDYSPYSKFQVYLPFVGVVHVDANDFVGHTIGVKYNIDALSGSCTAFITKDGSVMYTYSGNVALNVPLSSESWAQTWSAALNLIGSAVVGGVAGVTVGSGKNATTVKGAKGAWLNSKGNAADVATNPSVLSPQVNHSGAIGGSSGFMNVMTPYVIREAVNYQSTAGMNELKGYPLHSVMQLSQVAGYTEVSNVHLEGISATSAELDEIESLLAGGVIL